MTRITVAKGDGTGPEIMNATPAILLAADAQIELDEIEVGEQVYLAGNISGVSTESRGVIRRNRVFLEAPITTPQGATTKVSTSRFGKCRGFTSISGPA
jgi:isocitrate dehydrogenase